MPKTKPKTAQEKITTLTKTQINLIELAQNSDISATAYMVNCQPMRKCIAENKAVATIPEGLSFSTAAAILEGSHYALCDIRAAKVKKGQKVIVIGGTGAIGSSAVQMLKHHFEADVTAVCGSNHVDLVCTCACCSLTPNYTVVTVVLVGAYTRQKRSASPKTR